MRLSVLGGCGAWPAAGQACSGYLVEQEGFRLLLDPGYATLPRLLELVAAEAIDAVVVSHGHPDHCADLHPLLRARALSTRPPAPLPVYSLPGALDSVLALDPPGALDGAYELRHFAPADRWEVGPFRVKTLPLPHFVPNAGIRLAAAGRVLAYTGDTGPSPDVVALARDADVFIAEATFAQEVPERFAGNLSSGREAGEYAARAHAVRLLLTHLWPGVDPEQVESAARGSYRGPLSAARTGMVIDL